MQTTTEAEFDRAAAIEDIEDAVPCTPVPWRVAEVAVRPNFELFVRFRDGLCGIVRMREQIFGAHAGVFQALRDPAVFAEAFVDVHWVAWPIGLDLAPDAMYDEIKKHGEWVLLDEAF